MVSIPLTIITINFRNFSGLKSTLESVCRLRKTLEFEYVVIDGAGSIEETEFLRNQLKYIDTLVSEPDKGIYNAMNKGVSCATRDYTLFLNSGEILRDDIASIQLMDDDIYSFKVRTFRGGHRVVFGNPTYPIHQGIIMKRSLLEEFPFDENLIIHGDLDLWYRIGYINRNIEQNSLEIVDMNLDGRGTDPEFYIDRIRDRINLIYKYKKTRDVVSLLRSVSLYILYRLFGLQFHDRLVTFEQKLRGIVT